MVDDEESTQKSASAVSAAQANDLLQDGELQTFGKKVQQQESNDYEDDFEVRMWTRHQRCSNIN